MAKLYDQSNHIQQQRKERIGLTWFVIIAYFGSTNLYKSGDEL
jgi:hypothetical protein